MTETIRERLRRRVRWALALGLGGWVLVALAMTAFGLAKDQETGAAFGVQLVGFLMFGGGILAMARTKCPKCSATLGQLAASLAVPFVKQPNFCPYCGVSFDEPLPAKTGYAGPIT